MSKLQENLAIFATNIRSISANFHLLEAIPDIYNFHVILLYESWITSKNSSIPSLLGFQSFLSECQHNKSGGVVVYVKQDIPCELINVAMHLETFDLLLIKVSSIDLLILTIYRHPFALMLDIFMSELELVITEILLKNSTSKFIIVGDINIDVLKVSKCSKLYLQLLSSYNLTQMVKDPTRVSGNSCSLIDHVIVSDSLINDRVTIHSSNHVITATYN
jgi:hypothetical protein